jgi:hypothetical protein
MKYKVGDKVRIKSKYWYNKNKISQEGEGMVVGPNDRRFTGWMSEYCGKEATITGINEGISCGPYYDIDIDERFYCWDDWMFEDDSLDLTEILKDAPNNMELYSPAFGIVYFQGIVSLGVSVKIANTVYIKTIPSNGILHKYGEVMLFPSKDNRDWSTFKLPHWRAEKGGEFFYVNSWGGISHANDDYGCSDNYHYNSCNYFKTAVDAENSKFYKVFHEE